MPAIGFSLSEATTLNTKYRIGIPFRSDSQSASPSAAVYPLSEIAILLSHLRLSWEAL